MAYNPKSLHAEEFISDEEIRETLRYAEENKNTYVKLVGLEKSKELAKEYSEKAKKSLEMFGEKAEFLINLTDYLIDRKF